MNRVMWLRPFLWLLPLGVAPALLMDLMGIGPEDAGVWSVLTVMALWLGFPYYVVEALLGLLLHIKGPPKAELHVIAAGLTTLLLIFADRSWRAFVRATAPRDPDHRPRGSSQTPQN